MKIKICGITNLEDALVAAESGADALGFNFYPRSPRYIDPVSAQEIIAKLPGGIISVGVFVNSDVETIGSVASDCELGMVQLHGDEDKDFVDELSGTVDARIMKVIRIGAASDRATPPFPVDYYLLDSDSEAFGGSGETFDWSRAIEFKRVVPEFYLAGGLTPENVRDAVRQVRPSGVDVCSGVEKTKRKKDASKIVKFIRNARSAI